ncbi:hypothetical protein Slin14017_G036010 [Septoria linicola]|nr:hypothetical protein Slin14017_G036010 [Septoria linicola]
MKAIIQLLAASVLSAKAFAAGPENPFSNYFSVGASLTGTALTLLDDRNPCLDNLYDWCVGARLVLGNAQNSGEYVPAPHDTKLEIKVSYDDATKKHLQQVSIDGKVVSSLPVTSEDNLVAGRGIGFRTQIECQLDACGAVSSHSYVDTRIVLDSADPSFGSTKDVLRTTGDLKTANGGLTWTIDEIVVMSYTYDI